MRYFLIFTFATISTVNLFAQQNKIVLPVEIPTCGNYKTPIIPPPQIINSLIEIKPSANSVSKIIIENPCSVQMPNILEGCNLKNEPLMNSKKKIYVKPVKSPKVRTARRVFRRNRK